MYVNDKEFNNLFFSTPTAFSSVIISDPDLPPASSSSFGDEEETLSDQVSNFKVDKLRVSAPKVASKPASATGSKPKAPQTKAPPTSPAPAPPPSGQYVFFERNLHCD
jgi:hypothetical protein